MLIYRLFLVIASLAPGPIFLWLYNLTRNNFFDFHLDLASQKTNICLIVASFSFTMLGFLAASITIFFGISGKRVLDRYKKNGHLTTLIIFYFEAILCLFLTFGLAILALGKNVPTVIFDYMVASLINNFVHTLILTTVVVNLAHKGLGKSIQTPGDHA